MRIAIVGSRGWTDEDTVQRYINTIPDGSVVVSGGARGVDSIAEKFARARGLEVVVIKPDWSKGRGAGMERNGEIVAQSDVVVAFWDGKSPGTQNTINRALSAPHIKRIMVIKP